MKINNNISAVITNKQLLGTESSLAASMERLSSGLKINHAADNPSGIAISNKMKIQIKGLDQASRNSSDGTSVLQTVDGSLSQVTDMLQRIRELAVQAANGTNGLDEKKACQMEIASLRAEIDRVSSTTEFNTKSLLNGSLDAKVYANKDNINNVSRITVSETVAEGEYGINIEELAKQATGTIATSIKSIKDSLNTLDDGESAKLFINDAVIELTKDMTTEEIYTTLRDGAEYAECEISDISDNAGGLDENKPIEIKTKAYGSGAALKLLQEASTNVFATPNKEMDEEAAITAGENAKIKLDTNTAFSGTATVSYEGNRVKISDVNGFQMDMLLDPTATYTSKDENGNVINNRLDLKVTDIGVMDLQIGSNEGQMMQIRIPATDIENLYLDKIDVSTINGAENALDRIDEAMTKIMNIRSKIGAYENRLDYTTASLDETGENMTAALSRIEDVDMAEEMTEYTKYNILQQAGTSALAQANSLPELALQLLK